MVFPAPGDFPLDSNAASLSASVGGDSSVSF